MSDERIQKLEKTLQTLRKQVNDLSYGQHDANVTLRFAVLACTVAGVMLALTATTWRVLYAGDVDKVYTLWDLVPEAWQGTATLVLVVVAALGTFGVFLAESPARWVHLTLVVLALLTAVAVLVVGDAGRNPYYDADDYENGTGRLLTLLAALALAAVHGARAADLKR